MATATASAPKAANTLSFRSAGTKDVQTIKQHGANLTLLAVQQRRENFIRRNEDIHKLKQQATKFQQESERAFVKGDVLLAIIHKPTRKQHIKHRLTSRMTDEKELTMALGSHREEFVQFLIGRRNLIRREIQVRYRAGAGKTLAFSDLVSLNTQDAAQMAEKKWMAHLCSDAIRHLGVNQEQEIASYFLPKFCLLRPTLNASFVIVHENRQSFELSLVRKVKQSWVSVFASFAAAPWRLGSKTMLWELMQQIKAQLIANRNRLDEHQSSYSSLLARALDAVYPTRQLVMNVLAYPHAAPLILKRRLLSLSLLGNQVAVSDEALAKIKLDSGLVLNVLDQLIHRLEVCHRYFFEFQVPEKMKWIVGWNNEKYTKRDDCFGFPGQDGHSFALGSDGSVWHEGHRFNYMDNLDNDSHIVNNIRTVGLAIDFLEGSMAVVHNQKVHKVAFGHGAVGFDAATQEKQQDMIKSNGWVPMFGVRIPNDSSDTQNRVVLKTNFSLDGRITKHYLPLDKNLEGGNMINPEFENKNWAEEDDKIFTALQRNIFRHTIQAESFKSFSQFPPSIYRRNFACVQIQKAWRKHRGRQWRKAERAARAKAAVVIQRAVRSMLSRRKGVRDQAARTIQRNWRLRMYFRFCFMKAKHRKPLRDLHAAARLVQRKFRRWAIERRNAPRKSERNAREKQEAWDKIWAWWRPRHLRIIAKRKEDRIWKAALTVQRVYRGYRLRQLLRPDLRQRLMNIGSVIAKHRLDLQRIRGAYVLQGAWRDFVTKKVRAEKQRNRHQAATKIQALWKGFWVRSHVHLRFNYGEAIFLSAVCKALKQGHFTLKMYKPCGIVCPKPSK